MKLLKFLGKLVHISLFAHFYAKSILLAREVDMTTEILVHAQINDSARLPLAFAISFESP